jgi:GT2 family glycosyltransferase
MGRIRTEAEMWSELANAAWRHGEAAAAVGDLVEARRWLDRARRILPDDAMVALSLALVCLRDGDSAQSATLFESVVRQYDLAEAWTGLAAATYRLQQPTRATEAMHAALSRHVMPPTTPLLAATISQTAGWCGIDAAGRLHADRPATVTLDGVELRLRWTGAVCRLPPGGRSLAVTRNGVPLLGSPIDLVAIGAVEGFVKAEAGALVGWAWHPGDPGRDPLITVVGEGVTRDWKASQPQDGTGATPLARRRHFRIEADDLPAGLLHVVGTDGRDLIGSPLDPAMERRSAAGLSTDFMPVWADVVGQRPTARSRTPARRRAIDVVVPVYRGLAQTLACLNAVMPTLPRGSRLHVVDDAGPDPALAAALDDLARAGRIRLIRQPLNRGFPAAANAGMEAAAGRDVVLLNSDTLVPPGWLEALAEAAYSAPDIGCVSPLSNDATILSYPLRAGGNPMPTLAETARLAALARRANGDATVDIPVTVGFCMFIRRDCLDEVGPLREDLFAQGYGEENDFCLRARHRGWRHVAATGMFVAHEGAASFGMARRHLLERNAAILARLHPGYDALIADWEARDPLGPTRRRMDVLRWRKGQRPSAAILVTHAGGGGVDRLISQRVEALDAVGVRAIVLRPEGAKVVVGDGSTPNLRFAMPDERDALVRLLRADRPTHVELHHDLGHDPTVLDLAAQLGIPHEVYVHDYAWFCPRIALVPQHTYCGEPSIAGCEACIADNGSNLETDISVPELVARSARLLGAARQVVTPSLDVVTRLRRHFPSVSAKAVPWEDDSAIPPPPPVTASVHHVCVIGGIGVEKGYEVLLACVRDAAARRLDLSFTVIGSTADDARLLDAGPAFVTGRYAEDELPDLVRAHQPDVAFIPSIWPETWCFTLGHAWRIGLRTAVFDIGAPAERVRRTGWGWVLPLGLPAGAVNDMMLRLGQVPGIRRIAKRESASQFGSNPAI